MKEKKEKEEIGERRLKSWDWLEEHNSLIPTSTLGLQGSDEIYSPSFPGEDQKNVSWDEFGAVPNPRFTGIEDRILEAVVSIGVDRSSIDGSCTFLHKYSE